MRIDGLNNLNATNLPEQLGQAVNKNAKDTPAGGVAAVEGQFESSQAAYVAQAQAAPEVNESAVAEAKSLLAAGALDSAEAIARAAQRILDLGI